MTEHAELTFTNLPVEIYLHICSFLPATSLIVLSLTSKNLHRICQCVPLRCSGYVGYASHYKAEDSFIPEGALVEVLHPSARGFASMPRTAIICNDGKRWTWPAGMKQDYVLDTMARGHQKYHRLLTMLLLSELGDALRAVRFHVEDEEDYLVTWKTLWSRRVGSPIERDAHGTADFTHWGTNVRQLELYGITKDQTEWAWDAFPRLDELCLRVSPTFKGTIDHRKLNVPSASLEHLRKLELYGAWVMGIIPQADRFLRGLTNLKNLTHLIVDFDPRFPPEILHHVLSGLPNLRTIGRLGYVSRPFWRLFANRSLSHIRHLILGTSTTPHLPKVVVRRDFLADFYRDLPLGILLVCPDITRLDIFNGYREMELITPAIKRIQEGGLQVDPERKSRLRHIKVFDCAGLEESEKRELRLLVGLTVDVVQSSGWQSFGRGDAEPVRVAPKVVVQG